MIDEPGLLVQSGYAISGSKESLFQSILSMPRVLPTIIKMAYAYKVVVVLIDHHKMNGIQGYFRKSIPRD